MRELRCGDAAIEQARTMTPSVRVLTAPAARVARTGRGKALVCNAKQQHVTMVEVPTTPMQVRPLERTLLPIEASWYMSRLLLMSN